MKQAPIFLFAFANDETQTLQLKEEERIIRSLMDPLHDQKRIIVHYLSNTTIDEIYRMFNRFHNRITLFHYSGHSGSSFLQLEDKLARTSFLSTLMGVQKQLRLVFLNGCSNYPQVKELSAKGVPNIIATSRAIDDQKAVHFAKYFYQALSNNTEILGAFELAKSRVQNDYPNFSIAQRSAVIRPNQEKKVFPWGLYSEDTSHLTWTIPTSDVVKIEKDYITEVPINYPDVNKDLVELAFEGMSRFGEDYALLWKMYQASKSPQLFNTLQNMMLDSFPTSLGIQLRDLFTPEGKGKGRLRLQEINDTYLTLSKLLASISLANLWEKVIDKDSFEPKANFSIRQHYKADIKEYLELSPEQANQFDYVWLIATISRIFSDNQIQPFIEEFNQLFLSLYNFDEVYQAYRFLEQGLRKRLRAKDIAAEEVEDLCHDSEHHLGILLKKCAFLCAYQLVTIKDIGVSKQRRSKNPTFIHSKSILKGRDYATIDDKPIARKEFTSNNSVIVTKSIAESLEQLNLSPFVIDENAFKLQEDKLPKIHYFKGWTREKNLYYEHAELLAENFEIPKDYNKKKYKDLEILMEQFGQFKTDMAL